MDNPWMIIANAIAVLFGAAAALLSAKMTKIKAAAERSAEDAAEKDAALKKTAERADSIVPILMAMVAVEQELDGFDSGCGRCGRPIELCSPQSHADEKRERVMRYMKERCERIGAEFDYAFVDAKYNEMRLGVGQFKGK